MNERTRLKLQQMEASYNKAEKDYSDLAMGQDIPVVREDEVQLAASTYFQVIILLKDSWIPVSESVFAQYGPMKLVRIPKMTHVVVDALDNGDAASLTEYNEHINPNGTIDGGKLICFLADRRPEVDVTIALKLVSNIDGKVLIPPKAILRKI